MQYLLRQGYEPSALVVLTPYLGQLVKIHGALVKANLGALIDDLDFSDARKELDGLEGFALNSINTGVNQKKEEDENKCVRVATIDNYQGEEADVVIISLVRSNPEGSIGFLKSKERVNVLLSRARICEIIFGNAITLKASEKKKEEKMAKARALESTNQKPKPGIWTQICDHIEANNSFSTGLNVKCQNHGKDAVMTEPGDFARLSPDGGCTAACATQELRCGHKCPRRCHVGGCKCVAMVDCMCARGTHKMRKRCVEKDPPKCSALASYTCEGDYGQKHRYQAPCHGENRVCSDCMRLRKKIEDAEKKKEAAKLKAEETAKLAAERKLAREEEEELKRQAELEILEEQTSKEQDIANRINSRKEMLRGKIVALKNIYVSTYLTQADIFGGTREQYLEIREEHIRSLDALVQLNCPNKLPSASTIAFPNDLDSLEGEYFNGSELINFNQAYVQLVGKTGRAHLANLNRIANDKMLKIDRYGSIYGDELEEKLSSVEFALGIYEVALASGIDKFDVSEEMLLHIQECTKIHEGCFEKDIANGNAGIIEGLSLLEKLKAHHIRMQTTGGSQSTAVNKLLGWMKWALNYRKKLVIDAEALAEKEKQDKELAIVRKST